jgi:uncharacterized protein
MQPNSVVHAAALSLEHEAVPAEQSGDGTTTTAAAEIDDFAGLDVGVWEMSVGVMTDVEADELFVVLSGSARVEFADGTAIDIGAGDVVRLAKGAETVWTVTETLRKVYLARE